MKLKLIFSIVLLCSISLLSSAVEIEGSNRVYYPLKSMKELRDENIIKQTYDYSCGAGALATLLSYGIGDEVTEKELLTELKDLLSKQEVDIRKKTGFSLVDLQVIAKNRGYKSLGFKIAPDYLSQLSGPVIVFIKPREYEHFAVLKGIHGDRVYLADPSRGNIRMPAYQFLDMWQNEDSKGVIFVVETKNGQWPADYPLKLKIKGVAQPEMMSIRQMLAVGNSSSFN